MRASKPGDSEPVDERRGPDTYLNTSKVLTIMKLAGWTRAELARRMHMDQSAIARLLAGELQPSHRSIASLLIAVWRQFADSDECLCGDLFTFVDENGKQVYPPHDPRSRGLAS